MAATVVKSVGDQPKKVGGVVEYPSEVFALKMIKMSSKITLVLPLLSRIMK